MKIYDLIALFSKEFKKDNAIFISISKSILSSKTEEEKDAAIQTYIQNIHRICDASASLGLNGLYLFLQKLNQNLYELKSLDAQSQSMVEGFYTAWPLLVIDYLNFIVDNAPDLKGSPNNLALEEKSQALMAYLNEPPACIEIDSNEYEFIYSCLVEALQVDDKVKELIESISVEENSVFNFSPQDLLLEAENVSKNLLQEYLKESSKNIEEIYKGLDSLLLVSSLDAASLDLIETINSVKRSAHTIKGSSQMSGIKPISTLMHKLEDSLDNLPSLLPLSCILANPPAYAKICLPLIDFVSNFLEELSDFEVLAKNSNVLQNLQKLGATTLEHFFESIIDFKASPPLLPPVPPAALVKLDTTNHPLPLGSLAAGSPHVISAPAPLSHLAPTQMQMDKSEELFAITRFCAEAMDKLSFLMGNVPSSNDNIESTIEIKRLIDEVSKKQVSAALLCLQSKMVDIDSIHQRLSRIVRTSSVASSKAINFTFSSNSAFIESNILKSALDAFMHILRNCVDHGIESTELRAAAGKPLEGHVSFEASYLNNGVLFKISDDGYGLDLLKILNKAHQLCIVDSERYELISSNINWPDNRNFLLDLIFKENFSTKETLTTLSGRGVGLDIVKKIISNLGGTIEVKTKSGVFCEFHVWLPSSISLVQSVVFESNSQLYALPSSSIEKLVDSSSFKVKIKDSTPFVSLTTSAPTRLEEYPAQSFNALISLKSSRPTPLNNLNKNQQAIIFKDKELGALLVDSILTVQSLILEKPKCLGPARRYVSNISTINNGSIVSLINYSSLLDFFTSCQDSSSQSLSHLSIPQPASHDTAPKIFIIDDSSLMRKTLQDFTAQQGFDSMCFENGIDALKYLNKTLDSAPPSIVITDLEMPGLSGFETIQEMKSIFKNNPTLSLPSFIMLSSKATNTNIEKAKSLGCLDFVSKPYNEAHLLALLQSK